jgi:molybdenum cofactor cytidylyltransferase
LKVGAVILAAGESKRFGRIKQLLPLGGKPLLQHVIDTAELAGFSRIAVILGSNGEEIRKAIRTGEKTKVIINTHWEEGQSSSVRAGVVCLEKDCDAIIFLLGDQPFVTRELIHKEIQIFESTKAHIVAPKFGGHRGNPVLFSKGCYSDLKNLEGDGGGRQIFDKHSVTEFEYPIQVENRDIDTAEDYKDAEITLNARSHICTIILGAGLSSRMKQPKLLMAWGNSTVLGAVISAFNDGGVGNVFVVTGAFREQVENEAQKYNASFVFNPSFENGAMLDSIKTGIREILDTSYEAAFVALGDQPAVSSEDIQEMARIYLDTHVPLIIPSFEMRRGHPWLVSRELWQEILSLEDPKTMRDFIESNRDKITYYLVKSSRILDDLDTPEDYEKYRPR